MTATNCLFAVVLSKTCFELFVITAVFFCARAMLYQESLGSDFDAQTFRLAVNRYLPMGEQNVRAVRAVLYAQHDDGDSVIGLDQ